MTMNTVYQLTGLEILGISLGFFMLGLLFDFFKRLYFIFLCAFLITLIASASTKGFSIMFCFAIFYMVYVLFSDFKWRPTTLAASDLKVQINQHIEYERDMDEFIDRMAKRMTEEFEGRDIW